MQPSFIIAEYLGFKLLSSWINSLIFEITSTVYVIKLKEDRLYVGSSENFTLRMGQHVTGDGSEYTKQFPFQEILNAWHFKNITRKQLEEYEHVVTVAYMSKYGTDKVRGSYYCRVNFDYSHIPSLIPDITFETLNTLDQFKVNVEAKRKRDELAKQRRNELARDRRKKRKLDTENNLSKSH